MAAAQRILELRLEKELTQRELAWLLDVNPITVSRWERGEAHPSALVRVRLARFFEVASSEFENDDAGERVA